MKLRLSVLLLLFFVALPCLCASPAFTLTKSGIEFSAIGSTIESNNGSVRLRNQSLFVMPVSPDFPFADGYRFVVAVPQGFDPVPLSLRFDSVPLQAGASEIIKKYYAGKDDPGKVEFEELGTRRGVRMLLVKVFPYSISESGTAYFLRNLSFALDFGIELRSGQLPDALADLYASVANRDQIPALLAADASVQNNKLKSAGTSFNPADTAWYNPQLYYAKIVTKRDGVAFVMSDSLIAAQPAFANAETKHLRLLYRGVEVPYSTIPATDRLVPSTKLYFAGSHCPSDTAWFDYYTDETAFFMELNPDAERFSLSSFPTVTNKIVTTSNGSIHQEKDAIYFHLDENPYQTETTPSENWYWKSIDPFNNKNLYDTVELHPVKGESYQVRLRLGSWYCTAINRPAHRVGFYINNTLIADTTLFYLPRHTIDLTVPDTVFRDGANYIRFSSFGVIGDSGKINEIDVVGVDFYEIKGVMQSKTTQGKFFGGFSPSTESFTAKVGGFTGSECFAIETRNHLFGSFAQANGNVMLGLPTSAEAYSLMVVEAVSAEQAMVRNASKSNLRNSVGSASNMIIYHPKFANGAAKMKAYHDASGNRTEIVDIEDIYKEYSYGKKNPWAIRYFLRDIRARWQHFPEYLTLLGGGCTDARKLSSYTTNEDYVPGYGMPISDYWYSLLDEDAGSSVSSIIVGRIPVRTNTEVEDYLAKFIYTDTLHAQDWENKLIFISGGDGEEQRTRFRTVLLSGYTNLQNGDVCADSVTFSRYDDLSIDSQGPQIREAINNGTGFILFVGHGSPHYIDNDGWQVQRLSNTGKYSHLLAVSCNTGDYSVPTGRARNDEYVIEKDKGCVGALGFTYLSLVTSDYPIVNYFFSSLGQKSRKAKTYSALLNEMKDYFGPDYKYYISMILTYLGDPLSKIPFSKTDMFFPSHNISVSNHLSQTELTDFDTTAFVSVSIANLGFKPGKQFRVMAVRRYGDKLDTAYANVDMKCNTATADFEFPVSEMRGRHSLSLVIDPDSSLDEEIRQNNRLDTYFDVLRKGILMIDPVDNLDVHDIYPVFSFILPNIADSSKYRLEVSDAETGDTVFTSRIGDLSHKELYSNWYPQHSLTAGKLYNLDAYTLEDTTARLTMRTPFFANQSYSLTESEWKSFSVDLAANDVTNLRYDGSQRMVFDTIRAPFSITAATWDADSNCYRFEVVFRNKTIIEISHQGAKPRGFNIVTLSGTDLQVKQVVRFDTWGYDYEPKLDSTAVRMIAYLRDSISKDDYALIGTCDQAFRLPIVDQYLGRSGSIDTLKNVLRSYGLLEIDSLRYGTALAMVGKWGAKPGELPQAVQTENGKVIRLRGTLRLPCLSAEITSKLIGPAQSWRNFDVAAEFSSKGVGKEIIITGFDKDKHKVAELMRVSESLSVPLTSVSAQEYPYIRATLRMNKTSTDSIAAVKELKCNYVSAPEAAISVKNSGFVADTVMMGDSAEVKINFWNIAHRSGFKPFPIRGVLTSGTVKKMGWNSKLSELSARGNFTHTVVIPTDNLSGNCMLNVQADMPEVETEQYLFNNSLNLSLFVAKDKEKPKLKLFIGSKQISDGDYIPQNAVFRTELYDNSAIPVNKDEAIMIRLNGYILSADNTDVWKEENFGRARPLKYAVDFGKELSFNDNIVEVIGMDAAGNADTLNMRLWVSRDASFDNSVAIPNPTTGSCAIEFDLKTPLQSGDCTVEIFDLMGRKVRSIVSTVGIGRNRIEFDGLDSDGNLIPQGAYNYRLKLQEIWAEPLIGRFVVVR